MVDDFVIALYLHGRDLHYYFTNTYIRDAHAIIHTNLVIITSTPLPCFPSWIYLFQKSVGPFVCGCYPGRIGIALQMVIVAMHKRVESACDRDLVMICHMTKTATTVNEVLKKIMKLHIHTYKG